MVTCKCSRSLASQHQTNVAVFNSSGYLLGEIVSNSSTTRSNARMFSMAVLSFANGGNEERACASSIGMVLLTQSTPKFETITLTAVGLGETHALALEIAHRDAKESNAELLLLCRVGTHVRDFVQLLDDLFQHRLILRFTKAQPTDKVQFS